MPRFGFVMVQATVDDYAVNCQRRRFNVEDSAVWFCNVEDSAVWFCNVEDSAVSFCNVEDSAVLSCNVEDSAVWPFSA